MLNFTNVQQHEKWITLLTTLLLKLLTMLLNAHFVLGLSEWHTQYLNSSKEEDYSLTKTLTNTYHNVACFKVIKLLKLIIVITSKMYIVIWMINVSIMLIALNWNFQFAHEQSTTVMLFCMSWHNLSIVTYFFLIILKTGWRCIIQREQKLNVSEHYTSINTCWVTHYTCMHQAAPSQYMNHPQKSFISLSHRMWNLTCVICFNWLFVFVFSLLRNYIRIKYMLTTMDLLLLLYAYTFHTWSFCVCVCVSRPVGSGRGGGIILLMCRYGNDAPGTLCPAPVAFSLCGSTLTTEHVCI